MLKNSSKFINAIKSDIREMRARVTINNIVFEDNVINKVDFTGSALSGEQFSLGSTHENTVSIEFSEVIETVAPLDLVQVEIGVKRTNFSTNEQKRFSNGIGKMRMGAPLNTWNTKEEYEYSLMGEFYVSDHVDINYNDKITTLDCKDKMIFLEDAYVSKLKYPADIRNVIVEIANQASVEIDTLNIEELNGLQINKIEGYSHRQALGFIAQLLVGYATFNRKGLLQIRTLKDTEYEISPDEYFSKGLSKNGIRYKIRGITCTVPKDEEPQELFVGSKKGPQLTIENPLMTQNELQRIFNALQSVDYYPYDLSWRGNPALEIGDIMTVYDLEGNELKVPNLSYNLEYTGGLSATSSADSKSRLDVVPTGRKTYQQQIHATQTNIKETATNLTNAFKDAQEKITGNQGGFIIQRMNEDGKPYEFLVMDTEDINSATNVIRLNQQGIGFSQNGYNGPFGVAITIDGQIVADYITAGTLSADLIQSGFNGIAPGVSMTKDGLITRSDTGSYTQLVSGSLRIFDNANNMTGTFGLSSIAATGETGSAIFVSEGHLFGIVRNRSGESPNTTLLRVPSSEDEIDILVPIDLNSQGIRDASSVQTKNGSHTGIFNTWSTGEAFIGGPTGAMLGYRNSDGTLSAVAKLVKGENFKLYTNLDVIGKIKTDDNGIKALSKLDMNSQEIVNVSNLTNKNGSSVSAQFVSAEGVHLIGGSNGVNIGSRASNGSITGSFRVHPTGAHISYRDINMGGNNITNTSDIRLKKNIKKSAKDALKEIMRWDMIEYEFDKDIPRNKDMPDGTLFGISAQSAPSLQIIDEKEDSYLSVSLTNQINVLSLGMQQLIKKVTELEGAMNG
ncbi:tail fiber domain-containing protein [Jeotgalibaca porci]|uniref:tail fiber domain-containing protein n=1 Tax=Jeotgalibaca porci TaxID=1868793 RepID=UPI00359FF3D8